ncbi:unnamed protein product, partial [Polarella glacialis]
MADIRCSCAEPVRSGASSSSERHRGPSVGICRGEHPFPVSLTRRNGFEGWIAEEPSSSVRRLLTNSASSLKSSCSSSVSLTHGAQSSSGSSGSFYSNIFRGDTLCRVAAKPGLSKQRTLCPGPGLSSLTWSEEGEGYGVVRLQSAVASSDSSIENSSSNKSVPPALLPMKEEQQDAPGASQLAPGTGAPGQLDAETKAECHLPSRSEASGSEEESPPSKPMPGSGNDFGQVLSAGSLKHPDSCAPCLFWFRS